MSLIGEEDDAARASSAFMRLAQARYRLGLGGESKSDAEESRSTLMAAIEEHRMGALYESVCSELGWEKDEELASKLAEENATEGERLEAVEKDALENLGENEVFDAAMAKVDHWVRVGDAARAATALENAKEKAMSSGQRIDVTLQTIRLGLFHSDFKLVRERVEEAEKLVEDGGDWDRRNRLRVYQGVNALLSRDFSKASKCFLDSVATYTCYEMFSYRDFIFYTVVTNLLTLPRMELKASVIDSPEILTVIRDMPQLEKMVNALYDCHYSDFFAALVDVSAMLQRDRFLGPHLRHYLREIRIKAYAQFLASYKSVTLVSMSESFGVSVEFVDRELSRFIAAGRLNAKIDKVFGIVATNRPAKRNSQYQEVIRQGDLLLNRIQRLARVIDS
eukprot:PLAT11621.1.p2 GENE.PLAT11621.1~~PLAT11621.1.p2  ORF type:complete len:393 (+),score=178.52 PLAT11621.1:25-1203(+)